MSTMTSTNGQFWDGVAEKYAAQPVGDQAAFERKQAFHIGKLEPDHEILEVGCGTGSLALILAPHVAQVHGLDISAEMIRIANEKKAAQGVDNVTFHQGTLEDAPFSPGQLDCVSAYSLLHLVDDMPATLARIYALLKPGGHFISSTVCLGRSWVPYGLILPVMRWVGKAPNVSIFDRAHVVAAIREAGFVDVEEVDVGAKPVVAYVYARKPE